MTNELLLTISLISVNPNPRPTHVEVRVSELNWVRTVSLNYKISKYGFHWPLESNIYLDSRIRLMLCWFNQFIGVCCFWRSWNSYLPSISLQIKCNFNIPVGTQPVWISDGSHSVHMMVTMELDNALNATDENDGDERLQHLPGFNFCKQYHFSSVTLSNIWMNGMYFLLLWNFFEWDKNTSFCFLSVECYSLYILLISMWELKWFEYFQYSFHLIFPL